jgi:hypothetical protein
MWKAKLRQGLARRGLRSVIAAVLLPFLLLISLVPDALAQVAKDDFPDRVMRTGAGLNKRLSGRWSAQSTQQDTDTDPRNPYALGGKISFVPALGHVIWQLPGQWADRVMFSARIYQVDSNFRIGYIRFPRFEYDPDAVSKFSELISFMEKETQALVIDVVNNPGGSMFQMYAFLSYLTDKPLSVPKHEFRFQQDDVDAATEVVERADAGQLTSDDTPESVAYSRFVLSEVKEGRGLGTENTVPGFLGGVAEITPAPNHYTKKVVVVVNEASKSAAEFLAAIFQDNNHQAVIFGRQTGGAGGLVRYIELQSGRQFGIPGINLTWTLAWRTNGKPIENLGVTPDVIYEITVDDIRSGYTGYRKALLATITNKQ